jgi:Fe-S oxidoreductase
MSVSSAAFQQFNDRVKDLADGAPATTLDESEMVARAKNVFRASISTEHAAALETCIHCGICSEACHFFQGTGDPRYTPINKVAPLRRFYRREIGPFRWLARLLVRDISAQELRSWQELVYDGCTECGRCDHTCPMGIRISPMISIVRKALKEAGLMPMEMQALVREQDEKGTTFGVGPEDLRQACQALAAEGVQVPLDRERAEVLVLSTVADLILFNDSFRATAKIMNTLQKDWTLRSGAIRAADLCFVSGDDDARLRASKIVYEEARACGAKTVVVPECGMAYNVMRWEAANLLGESPGFEVLAISEFIGKEISAGRLKLQPGLSGQPMTYHDPCKVGRQSGVFREPRTALEALGVDVREMESKQRTNYCCGGGSGVFLIKRAANLRQRAFEIKMHEADESGAAAVVTACDSCRINFTNGAARANWRTPIKSLVCLVAENLAD